MIFRTAVDWWFYAVIFGSAVIVVIAVIPLLGTADEPAVLVAASILALAVGLPIWLLVSTYYRVDADSLYVRSGPLSWTIPKDEIHAVRASRSILSSPALSLDRIEIRYGGGKRILVSPKDRDGFLAAIGHEAA